MAGFAAVYPRVAFNVLWPRHAVVSHATDSFARKSGSDFDEAMMDLTQPSIMADAAYRIVTSTNHSTAFLDVELLRCMGVTNFDPYLLYPEKQDIDKLPLDYFLGQPVQEGTQDDEMPPHDMASLQGKRLLVVGDGTLAQDLVAAATAAGMQVEHAPPYMEDIVAKFKAVGATIQKRWGALDAVIFADDLDGNVVPIPAPQGVKNPQLHGQTYYYNNIQGLPVMSSTQAQVVWDSSFLRLVKATYYCLQAVCPLLRKGTNPRIVEVTPPPMCDPEMFKHSIPEATCKHMQAMFVIGHADEFDGVILSNGLWPGRGGGKMQAADCLKLLASTDHTSTGNFYSALPGGHVPPPKPSTPWGSHMGHPFQRYADKECWMVDMGDYTWNERAES